MIQVISFLKKERQKWIFQVSIYTKPKVSDTLNDFETSSTGLNDRHFRGFIHIRLIVVAKRGKYLPDRQIDKRTNGKCNA